MINKIIQMANERMHICIECPVYNSTTRTCGMPLNKLNPFSQPVTLDGVTFKPCGCFLDLKTKMTFADCPAGKWPKIVDAELVEQAKALVEEVKRTNVLSDGNRKLLTQLDTLMKGTNTKTSSCIPCINKIISELNNQLKREEVLLTEEETPQPKKRGRKSRKSGI
jgi:hypothetical protein